VPSSKSRAAVSIDATRTPKSAPVPGRRTYVLDTSVLLADPGALRRFAEHEVVLPVVVITEL
jgi:PhoH-like ATPase